MFTIFLPENVPLIVGAQLMAMNHIQINMVISVMTCKIYHGLN